ncbi:MAG: GDP-mannose 4,6-dehydratase [Fibrobacteraceae bacterium]|nr:GDP-mannose 4,6-dehydratase [Fibrobacteraceae bacterium]
MKRTLVIGANGFVGNYLVKELESNGHEVFAATYPEVDLLKPETITLAVQKSNPDFVVNLAAISSVGASWQNPKATMEVNVNGTLNLLDTLRQQNATAKVLLIGSAEEYAPKQEPLKETDALNASNPYGISKIAQENFAFLYRKKYGIDIVCTRSFNHIGIGQTQQFVIPSFCNQVAKLDNQLGGTQKTGKIFVGNLEVYRDFSDVRDVVKVYRMLLEKDTKKDDEFIYNVGSGKAYKLSELLDYIISLASVKIETCIDPQKMRPADNPFLCADNSKIKSFWPNTDIKQTIKELFQHFKAEPI